MALRRLHHEQPESFAFTAENKDWAAGQIAKYPEGRQASAIIPLLWKAQAQAGGWLPRPAIEHVADMLGMPYIRALEVATFYSMFNLAPVGKFFVQVCGTTPCMLRGSDDVIAVCKDKIGPEGKVSADGTFSWLEVECLGACCNAPMVQVNDDYYEDLTRENFSELLDDLKAGKARTPGSLIGRKTSEPVGGLTSLTDPAVYNGTATATKAAGPKADDQAPKKAAKPKPQAQEGAPALKDPGEGAAAEAAPELLKAPKGEADDLKKISGVGPKLETLLNEMGFWHFSQIAAWTPENVAWVDARLKFKGRIERDDWIGQAKILAGGGETEFSKRVEKGDVPSSKD
ncbi:NADH-quinone oxidoreductase subunit NuoE [Futiania mangrovi]|uniref:NADH-quinone oxidoreductase subunit NuoE n=1 Tax=Futiania mangrovi TaxID=2959716 RepID=A0A9J6P812_9PROT|nr:NADH-quinone oxidoreductase subunit NuoE [Futiania mangrovii]MCP1335596.1 NADH-quinone oxidoreductase subunit NuoE [Futiania mangrovii]